MTAGLSVAKALDNSNFVFADGSYLEYSKFKEYGMDSVDGKRLNTYLHFDPIYLNTFVGYDFLDRLSSLSELKLGIIDNQLYYDWSLGFGVRVIGISFGSHILCNIGISNISNELKISVWDPTGPAALVPSDYGYNYHETNNSRVHPSFGISFTVNTLSKSFLKPYLNASSKFFFSYPDDSFTCFFLSNAVSIGVLKDFTQTSFLLGFKIGQMFFNSNTNRVNPIYWHPSLVFQAYRTFR
jgi:hypothetical protein